MTLCTKLKENYLVSYLQT